MFVFTVVYLFEICFAAVTKTLDFVANKSSNSEAASVFFKTMLNKAAVEFKEFIFIRLSKNNLVW